MKIEFRDRLGNVHTLPGDDDNYTYKVSPYTKRLGIQKRWEGDGGRPTGDKKINPRIITIKYNPTAEKDYVNQTAKDKTYLDIVNGIAAFFASGLEPYYIEDTDNGRRANVEVSNLDDQAFGMGTTWIIGNNSIRFEMLDSYWEDLEETVVGTDKIGISDGEIIEVDNTGLFEAFSVFKMTPFGSNLSLTIKNLTTGSAFEVGTNALNSSNALIVDSINGQIGLVDEPLSFAKWTEQSPANVPSDRRSAKAVEYDGKIIMFGGIDIGGTVMSDTWQYDSSGWQELFPSTTPTELQDHGMAVLGDKIIMAGGRKQNGNTSSDTFSWDGTDWTNITITTLPRSAFGIATLGENIYLFGGKDENNNTVNDTFLWDGTDWTQLSPANPPIARYLHGMATLGENIYVFGGITSSRVNDTLKWDGTDWTQLSPATPPPERGSPALAKSGNTLIMFGGENGATIYGDTWEFDGTEWEEFILAIEPEDRYGSIFSSLGNVLILFGGYDGAAATLDDTWELELDNNPSLDGNSIDASSSIADGSGFILLKPGINEIEYVSNYGNIILRIYFRRRYAF